VDLIIGNGISNVSIGRRCWDVYLALAAFSLFRGRWHWLRAAPSANALSAFYLARRFRTRGGLLTRQRRAANSDGRRGVIGGGTIIALRVLAGRHARIAGINVKTARLRLACVT
jgi:hypothetical protein